MAVVEPETRHFAIFKPLARRLSAWWNDGRLEARLGALPADELRRLARDAGFNSSRQMLDVAGCGADAADEMPVLASQLGVDIEQVREAHPEAVRQMDIACCCCDRKADCRSALEAETAARTFDHFCPNGAEFKSFINEV